MKQITRYLVVLSTALCLAQASPVFATAQETSFVQVTGYAEKEVVPDMAYITLGMETAGSKLEEARAANSAAMHSLENELLQLGITKENLRTLDYRVYPQQDRNGIKLISYTVTNHLKVLVKDLKLLPRVFEKAATCGINSIEDIEYACADANALKTELIKAAVANGRLVAEAAVTSAGSQLGQIKEIHINGSFGGFTANRVQNIKLAKSAGADMMPVLEQGTQKLSESVNLVFYIKNN